MGPDDISLNDERIPEGASIISAHACGIRSDLCIDIAIEKHAPLAILPCCYLKAKCEAPRVLQDRFGFSVAYDVDRTYTLERAGYSVTWSEIPPAISNRARR